MTCNTTIWSSLQDSVEANIVPRKIQTEIAVGSFQELEQTTECEYVDFPYKSSVHPSFMPRISWLWLLI